MFQEGTGELKTLKVREQTHVELSEIRREIMTRTGEPKTYDQVIKELINFWKKGMHTTLTTKVIFKSNQPPPGTIDPRFYQSS